ncbi:Spc98 family-domain-containing protein [Plectosphaerella plurivora]|uniref:DASH complex subunit ASK1 n=1 Tax=Plectosphaerella plurivora TaxID=936078 RepID=A0A9P8VEJ0_9PEZI|nr:Spc98 family-domain-containing protein [Plectosphaerella plurivora]
MPGQDDVGNLFAVPDFFKPSKWSEDDVTEASRRFFRLELTDQGKTPLFVIPPIENKDFFTLPTSGPELSDTGAPPISTEDPNSDEAPVAAAVSGDGTESSPPVDVWLSLKKPTAPAPAFKTWDAFAQQQSTTPKPQFITEAGPGVFDALLKAGGDALDRGETVTVDTATFCRSLLSLVLGRESVLFAWDEATKTFQATLQNLRISGHARSTLEGVVAQCLECGNAYKQLEKSAQTTYERNPTSCRVALSSAADRVLLVIQTVVAGQQPRSLLQLQAVVRRVHLIITHLRRLVLKTRREKLDEDVLVLVFQQAQADQHGDQYLARIMREVLQRVARPWLDFLEEWIGTKPEVGVPLRRDEAGRCKGFVKVAAESYVDDHGDEVEDLDFHLDQKRMPAFIPADIALSMFEAGRNLRFIRANHPDHVLAHPVDTTPSPPDLVWHFDWPSIHSLEEDAQAYEEALVDTILSTSSATGARQHTRSGEPSSGGLYQLQMFSTDEAELQKRLAESMVMLSRPRGNIPGFQSTPDPLDTAVQEALSPGGVATRATDDDFAPHWSLIPVLSLGSLVGVQNRILGRESLKMLFVAHQLKEHLRLQRDFHLCRNGMFCSRLTHALFDPDMESAERQAGVARNGGVMGLRLSGRDTWPPASSELRLALMGVLAETFDGPLTGGASLKRDGPSGGLPGDLSFSVRDLSSTEIDKCLDPDGLEALDFLRLSYKTPPALMSVITPVILVQYDRIFKLLLRVLRMQYTVGQLYRDVTAKDADFEAQETSIRFCFEARHFVFNLSAYLFDVGIDLPWQDLDARVAQVETLVFQPGAPSSSSLTPDRLREYHGRVLDRIMAALLLRKRQQPVMELLEEIFRIILRFAKHMRLRTKGSAAAANGLYAKFRKGVEVFLTVCKAIVEKHGARNQQARVDPDDLDEGQESKAGEENPLAQLLLRLDMPSHAPNMSRPGPAARNLTLTEELEKLEQSITLTLQEIDHNFSKAHRIVTTSILPVVEQYGEHSKNVWEASKFWKQFFEASANVSLSGYEELANDEDGDETATGLDESSMQDGTTTTYTPRADRGGQDDTAASVMDQSGLQGDESLLDDDGSLTGSTPRAPATRTIKANVSNFDSPYEALKREMKGGRRGSDVKEELDDEFDDNEEEDSTVIFAQHTARLPDMSMTPHLPRGEPSPERKSKDPLLHRILDKNYRIQATPHKGPQLRVSPFKGKGKASDNRDAYEAPAPAWQDSPMSSPIMEMPKLRSAAFMSPVKTAARQRLADATAGPRTPGVSVQTPGAGRKKTRDFLGGRDDDEEFTEELPAKGHKYEIDWESDSDDGAFGGMSPPKTIQFALPPSKLLQTPAREASKRIVDDILLTAGAEPDSPEYSPTMVKMNKDILDDSF